MSNNLAREQKVTIMTLGSVTLILAICWCLNEMLGVYPNFNFEPFVTGCASFIPVITLWWPFKPKYRSSRLKGEAELSFHEKKDIILGNGEASFNPTFSENSTNSVHLITRYNPDLLGSAVLSKDINHFVSIKDASSYGISIEDKSPDINDIFILKNRFGNYALMKVVSISESTGSVAGQVIKIKYVINPSQGVNFS